MKKGKESKYLGFEPITLMPFEPHLIMPELMTHKQVINSIFLSTDTRYKLILANLKLIEKQLNWLNQYHVMVRMKVGEELKKQNRMRGFFWLMSKTRHITEHCRHSDSNHLTASFDMQIIMIAHLAIVVFCSNIFK
jgi:Xaa-Pro aminopeptidase